MDGDTVLRRSITLITNDSKSICTNLMIQNPLGQNENNTVSSTKLGHQTLPCPANMIYRNTQHLLGYQVNKLRVQCRTEFTNCACLEVAPLTNKLKLILSEVSL